MSMKYGVSAGALVAALMVGTSAYAGVSAEDAAKLGTSLTPMGAEKAGNADGSIPEWTGGIDESTGKLVNYSTSLPNPFASDKPLFSITPANMAQYADKLTEGVQQVMQKYPDTFRIDVYKTMRTAAYPKYVYENTKTNAVNGALVNHVPQNVFGGIPFPIPSNGEEAIWNHNLKFNTPDARFHTKSYLITASGQMVNTNDGYADSSFPYYGQKPEDRDPAHQIFWLLRFDQLGPPIRAGESVMSHFGVNYADDASWVYLTGQRRVRKLPNACCDTTHPASAGVFGFDEIFVWTGRTDRYTWNLVGKKEMYIPANSNISINAPSDASMIKGHHINPDYVRYELHRVWVVDAELAPGQRHTAPKARFYFDEDTWMAVEGDRWDANGQFWKMVYNIPVIYTQVPTTFNQLFGFLDLNSGAQVLNSSMADVKSDKVTWMEKWPAAHWTADSLVADAVR